MVRWYAGSLSHGDGEIPHLRLPLIILDFPFQEPRDEFAFRRLPSFETSCYIEFGEQLNTLGKYLQLQFARKIDICNSGLARGSLELLATPGLSPKEYIVRRHRRHTNYVFP